MPYADNPFLSRGLASTTLHPLGLEVSHAKGPWIHLSDGTRLFDAISGIGVTNFGHGNEAVKGQLQAQLDRHLHTMVYGEFLQDAQTKASALLRATLPDPLDAVYFLNSGAEAIDAALKLARRVTGRSRLMAVTGSYHGNTLGSLSVSANESRKAAYRPLLPEVEFLSGTTWRMWRALTTPSPASSWKPFKATPACASLPTLAACPARGLLQGRCAPHPRRDSMRHGTHRQALGLSALWHRA